ncbi:MFS transporter [Nocardioides silvaticus]|uniref:MFS transporter n=2 Tax=Nocardioides silvaticus TaxID=2201891 RepID=A0A316TRW2_9ACTN|nr:MFS transporter [Nocardioides silvaticus]
MIIPALPTLQRELDTTTTWVTWLLTGFLLSSSIATPLLGKLGDQHGKERLLLVSLGIFFVGCVGAIFAQSIWMLIAFRILQGAGGAVFPLSFAIIKDEFPEEKVGVGVGVVSSVFAVGGGLGLVLSGVIVDNLSWRWIFVVGAIAVGIAAVLVVFFVPESPVKTPSRLDVPGAILFSGGLLSLLLALTEGNNWGWGSGRIVALLVASAALLVVWGAFELRVPEPMVDMRMLARRPVLFSNLTGLIAGFAMFGSFVLIPIFAETPQGLPDSLARLVGYGFGASTTTAGLYLLPGALAGFVSGPLAGVLGRRYGSKWPMALGMAMASVGLAMFALWHDHPWQIVLGMIVLGGGIPFTFAAMAKVIVDSVRPSETGVATGMNTVMRTVGGVIGGQVGAAILTADTIRRTNIPAESAFVTAFSIGAAAALVAVFVALLVTPRLPQSRHVPVAEAVE